ncbi:MAG: DUF4954 family protein [Planctomycetota bacterium]|nr:DUF4954 family protein [Planctomycetota bacterium]
MPVNAAEAVRRALQESTFLKGVAAAKKRHGDASAYRALTAGEIAQLEKQHNAAADWKLVLVAKDFNASKVVDSYFAGPVRLGSFNEPVTVEKGVQLGSGVYRADLSNVTVGNNALVLNVGLLANAVIGDGAVVKDCGTVVCTGATSFGSGAELPIAIETGGRETPVYAELSVEVAAAVAGNRKDKTALEAYAKAVAEYVAAAKSELLVVEAGAHVKNTPKVVNAYVGPGAVIDSAAWVENAALLSLADEPAEIKAGAYVKNAVIQWGADVNTMGLAVNSVLCEHSHVERHGKLTDSILGPNSGVAEGECTASLCGPFVGFHHQSLLIAAYWPEGKGNVGYGANVGSNHTSKAPDQEIWCGEGTFFGLGVNIKFPSDFTGSPYSIIASGVGALPQRVEMPFALINTPAERIEGVSPAYNEIMPGWVLSDNIYTVRRNEGKYKKRNKAKRSAFDFEVFRPDVVDLMKGARKKLQEAEGKSKLKDEDGQPVYTDREVKGLGKNYMKEGARVAGVEAYTFYLGYYALLGLKKRLESGANAKDVLAQATNDPRWEHERKTLLEEFPSTPVKDLLAELVRAQDQIAKDTQVSKEKDDQRGARIIRDYGDAHKPASSDSFVKETHEVSAKLKQEVEALLGKL